MVLGWVKNNKDYIFWLLLLISLIMWVISVQSQGKNKNDQCNICIHNLLDRIKGICVKNKEGKCDKDVDDCPKCTDSIAWDDSMYVWLVIMIISALGLFYEPISTPIINLWNKQILGKIS